MSTLCFALLCWSTGTELWAEILSWGCLGSSRCFLVRRVALLCVRFPEGGEAECAFMVSLAAEWVCCSCSDLLGEGNGYKPIGSQMVPEPPQLCTALFLFAGVYVPRL